MHHFRFAYRSLLKSPGFTVVAVLTLALGIGFSTSSFSMANTFLLRNLPYPENTQLVRVFRTSPQSTTLQHAPANLLDVRASVKSFSTLAIFNPDSFALAEPGQPAEQVGGMRVTTDFFDVIRVQPMLGRAFAKGEDDGDDHRVAVLSYRAWIRRYAASPSVLGRQVRLNSQSYTIVGVMPAQFDAPLVWGPVDFILPRGIIAPFRTDRVNAWMQAVGRLKPGVTQAEAQAELDTIAARLAQEFPKENGRDGLRVVDLFGSNMDRVSRALLWLMTALATTMLLIACANLASLQVARALGRSREFAVRAALGGDRGQLIVPLLAESVLLSALGGVLGLLVASWSNDIIGSYLLINDERGFSIPIDGRVLTFAVLASIASGFAFGLAPAWLAARTPAAEALKEGSRGTIGGASHHRLKRILIVTEITLAIALVGTAAGFGVGAKAFSRRSVGWQPDGLCVGYVALPYNRYNDDQCRTFQKALLDRLAAIPGVTHAVVTTGLPVFQFGRVTRMVADGQPVPERGHEPTAETGMVSADYFAALGIPLRQGRVFAPTLQPTDPLVAVVNESFARHFWPGESAVGRRVRFAENEQWYEIIGVVADVGMAVRADTPETRLHLYRPLVQDPSHYLAVIVRGRTAPESFVKPMRDAVAALDPDLPLSRAGSLRAEITRNLSNIDLVIINLGTSAGMGLLIAAVGLFGVISQLTVQRTRDIGVRMALGAQASDILRLVLGEGGRLLAVGILAGVPLLWALTTLIQRTMPEIPLPGSWSLLADVALLSATMIFATWLPARRATLINPVEALRAD